MHHHVLTPFHIQSIFIKPPTFVEPSDVPKPSQLFPAFPCYISTECKLDSLLRVLQRQLNINAHVDYDNIY